MHVLPFCAFFNASFFRSSLVLFVITWQRNQNQLKSSHLRLGLDDMVKIDKSQYFGWWYNSYNDMNNIKKSLTAKNTHNRCLYLQTSEKWICQVYETSFYKIIYFRNKLMFIFNLYLAFIQTRNVKLPSNKHKSLRLIINISIFTSNYNIGWLFL